MVPLLVEKNRNWRGENYRGQDDSEQPGDAEQTQDACCPEVSSSHRRGKDKQQPRRAERLCNKAEWQKQEIGMNGKDVARPVVLEETFSLEPTPRRLKAHEEVLRVTEIVECLELEGEDRSRYQQSDRESDEIPSIPARHRANFRSEHLPPAKLHWAKYGFAVFFRNAVLAKKRSWRVWFS